MSPRIQGTLGYVLGEQLAGWVRWSTQQPGRIRLLRGGRADELVSVQVLRETSEDGRLTQHFEMRGIAALKLADLLSGALQVEAGVEGVEPFVLPVWGVLRLAEQILPLSAAQRQALSHWVALLDGQADALALAARNAPVDPVPAALGFGQVSDDGDVVCGRNGHLFLGEGSNRVQALYTLEPDELPSRWSQLFSRRADRLQTLGIRYLQIVLPEKSSALHWFCPFETRGGASPLLQAVLASAPTGHRGKFRLFAPSFGSDPWAAAEAFQLRDSHLSTAGAARVVTGMLQAMGLDDPGPEPTEATRLMKGDLAGRFPGDQRELVRLFTELRFRGRISTPELVERVDPPQGHRGIRRVWRNPAAPFPHRVVAMANSFFERGGASTQLSWWCAHLFAEFHFCWDPEVDEEYLRQVAPDWVIGQTIERFLRIVPAR